MRVLFFIICLLIVGLVATVLGFVGLLYPWVSLLILVPIFAFIFTNRDLLDRFNQLNWINLGLISLIGLIWVSHSIQVFVPETGFDAVWYHLPVAQAIVENHRIIYLPTLYQSLNPLFSDLFFVLGFQLAGSFGTKLVAYGFGLSLMIISFRLARNWLDRTWALIFTIIISTFQVVAWQSASFYIDVAKAFWEIAALFFIFSTIRHSYFFAGVSFGASLASKIFSLGLYPFFSLLVMLKSKNSQRMLAAMISSLLVAAPFYIFSFVITGNPFYSVTIHLQKLSEIGGSSTIVGYTFERLVLLPTSLVNILFVRDYTAPFLFLFGMFVLIAGYKMLAKSLDLKLLLLFVLNQWLIWWFVPPLSTRYALSGFIALALVIVILLKDFYGQYMWVRKPIVGLLLLTIIVNMLPRVYVNYRSLRFLISGQPKEIYLEQFYDGWIDQHLKHWHQIEN